MVPLRIKQGFWEEGICWEEGPSAEGKKQVIFKVRKAWEGLAVAPRLWSVDQGVT